VANIKSQIKRNKQNLVRQERNTAVRSALTTRVRVAVTEAEAGADTAAASAVTAQKRIGKAAKHGVIHPNAAARRQSRLARRLNALRAASGAES
jgi:small subunit ribosomal protein S20